MAQRTSIGVANDLFDIRLLRMRRARAQRTGPDLFLHERAFADCLDRISLVQRRFRSALLVDGVDPGWPERLLAYADSVHLIDAFEPAWRTGNDLCVSVGALDLVNDLPGTLMAIRSSLTEDALFIGALSGSDTLPQLRAAMRAADEISGEAVPHVHPRIEASALAALLAAAGFAMPVVDVDRVQVSYASMDRLVGDLRAMGATNVLRARSRRPLSKAAAAAASAAFTAAGDGERTVETFEILHFAAWTPGRR